MIECVDVVRPDRDRSVVGGERFERPSKHVEGRAAEEMRFGKTRVSPQGFCQQFDGIRWFSLVKPDAAEEVERIRMIWRLFQHLQKLTLRLLDPALLIEVQRILQNGQRLQKT